MRTAMEIAPVAVLIAVSEAACGKRFEAVGVLVGAAAIVFVVLAVFA